MSAQGAGPRILTQDEFLSHIGLDGRKEAHRHLFRSMLAEATIGGRSLVNQNGGGPSTGICEERFKSVIQAVYNDASPATRRAYSLGIVTAGNGSVIDNWVIRWLLWRIIYNPTGE